MIIPMYVKIVRQRIHLYIYIEQRIHTIIDTTVLLFRTMRDNHANRTDWT